MKILMKGNEAIAEAALRAGCECFFGYPITPQTELLQYMAKKLLKSGGVFIQQRAKLEQLTWLTARQAVARGL